MKRFVWILGVTAVACGGNVVFVEDGGEGGSNTGGNNSGGAPTTSNMTTGVMQTTVSTTNQTTNDVATTSVGGGPGGYVCEFEIPSDECNACAADVQFEECGFLSDQCTASEECSGYAQCVVQCASSRECCADCESAFPEGGKLYSDFVFCIVCEHCPEECSPAVPGFCF